MKQLRIEQEDHVALVELRRPPHNFVDVALMTELADTFQALDEDTNCRTIVLASDGRSFCAGADFNAPTDGKDRDPSAFYTQAMRLFRTSKPVVAAVHGSAVGAGLGLAVAADFRVTCKQARFSANFNRLGFHPGFGLSLTLPRLIGEQRAALLFYTGRRIDGEEAVRIGLADVLTTDTQVREEALALAREVAGSAPLAVKSTRAWLRRALADEVSVANQFECEVQQEQYRTEDFREGVRAMTERREPVFQGR